MRAHVRSGRATCTELLAGHFYGLSLLGKNRTEQTSFRPNPSLHLKKMGEHVISEISRKFNGIEVFSSLRFNHSQNSIAGN